MLKHAIKVAPSSTLTTQSSDLTTQSFDLHDRHQKAKHEIKVMRAAREKDFIKSDGVDQYVKSRTLHVPLSIPNNSIETVTHLIVCCNLYNRQCDTVDLSQQYDRSRN